MPDLSWDGMPIHQAIKADWKTPELLIEGSLGCAKTTVALDKEVDALLKWPGIPTLLFRWTEDAVATKLKTAFEEILNIRNISAGWEAKQKMYVFDNGSRAFMFGLKSVSAIEQFNKIRGLGVARIMGDQVEEMQRSVAGELRGRLRPDLTATIRGVKYPFQLTFVANPSDDEFWLSKEFPVDNHIKGRKLYSLSVFDNPHLPQETIDGLVRAYAADHPKHRTMILGQRGMSIDGDPVFEGLYRKDLHWRSLEFRMDMPVLESFEVGKHSPCWVFGQAMYSGGLAVHGGIMCPGLSLEDFIPIVQQYREAWIPKHLEIKSCISPMGEKANAASGRHTGIDVLRKKSGIIARWTDNGNAPDVRLGAIEEVAAYLRRRNSRGEESFAVNNDDTKFLIINKDGPKETPFVHHAMEAGYIWDKYFVSVANKELKQPFEDDKYANAMHAVENIQMNFCAGKRTAEERSLTLAQNRARSHNIGGRLLTGDNSWMQ